MRKLSYLFVTLAVLMSIVGLACGPDTSLGLVDHKTITGILEGTKYTILIYRSDEEGSPALYVKDQDLLDRITIEEVNLVIDDALALDIESMYEQVTYTVNMGTNLATGPGTEPYKVSREIFNQLQPGAVIQFKAKKDGDFPTITKILDAR